MQTSPLELIDDVRLTLHQVYQRLEKEADSLDIQIIKQLAEQIIEAVKIDQNACLASILLKDNSLAYSAQHAIDVGITAAIILKRMNFNQSPSVVAAALCMNISYSPIFNQLLFSQARLNAIQKQAIEQHPKIAHETLSAAGCQDNLWLDCVLYHHEMLDGSGYPNNSSRSDIPPMARLLAICDYFCFEIQGKKYADGQALNDLMIDLFSKHNKQFDVKLAPLFFDCFSPLFSGLIVETNNDANAKYMIVRKAPKKQERYYDAKALSQDMQLQEKSTSLKLDQITGILGHAYQLKISAYQLFDYPAAAAAQAPTARIIGRPPTKMELVKTRRIIQAADLPVMPEIVDQVQAEVDKSEPDVNLIAHLISSDMALSALIIRSVSKMLKNREPVQSIQHAITILGLDNLNNLVKTAGLTLSFNDLNEKLLNFWEDAQTMALAAARIAEDIEGIEPEEAYMAGLFQCAGCLLLSIKFNDYFDKTFDKAIKQPLTFLAFEKAEYGTDRGLVAYMLCHEWALPEATKMATYFRYIQDYSEIKDIKVRTITAVISLASYLTDLVNKFTLEPNDEQTKLLDITLEELMLDYDSLEKMKSEIMIEMK